MEVYICKDEEQMGRVAAEHVVKHLLGKPNPVLGVATGSSPLTLYANLARMQDEGIIDFSKMPAFALDEYVGISIDHPESYYQVIHRTVTEPLRMDPNLVHVPNGRADDLELAAKQYEDAIREAGGIDVQILGVGTNGHVGFNEPYTSFYSRTHALPLTSQTRKDNARFFDSIDEVPTAAITQGLGTILDSGVAVFVANGEHKADAIAQLVEGPVAVRCPASFLQLHSEVIVVIDEAAASKLKDREHFFTL